MKRMIAVYDEDHGYAERLAEVVNADGQTPFEAVPFYSAESLLRFARANPIELLLAGSSADPRVIREAGAEKVVYLTDGKEASGEGTKVYKYQSSGNILREAIASYCDDGNGSGGGLRRTAEIYGVFSPLGKCGKTMLSITMAKILSQEKPTLYVNLEEFSGFGILMEDEYRSNLSDLLYYFSSGEFSESRLRSIVHSMNGLDYIPPVRYPEDLDLSKASAVPELIRKIAKESAYRYIVVDAGRSRRMTVPVLSLCAAVFMPVLDDPASAAKIAEFMQYLEASGSGDVARRIRQLHLPRAKPGQPGRNYYEPLVWGDFGRYVREVLMEERGPAGTA